MPVSIDDYADRMKRVGVLYVDVYPFRRLASSIEYLLLHRRDDVVIGGTWQPVCGKIRNGERISEAFNRQVMQKTGQTPLRILKINYVNQFYDDYYDTVMLVPSAAAEITHSPVTIDSSLHTEHAWVTFDKLASLVSWPNQLTCFTLLNSMLCSRPDLLDSSTADSV